MFSSSTISAHAASNRAASNRATASHATAYDQGYNAQNYYPPKLFEFKRHDPLHFSEAGIWRIQKGYVRTLTWDAEGKFVPLGFWQKGDIVGSAIAQANPYKAQCLTDVVAEYLGSRYAFSKGDVLAQVRQSNELLQISHCRSAEMRLLSFLCWAARRFGERSNWGKFSKLIGPIAAADQDMGKRQRLSGQSNQQTECYRCLLRLTHQEISESIGITRVTVTRLLKSLERDGFIQWNTQEKVVFQKAFQQCRENLSLSRGP